jgi:hypothetical protein
MKSKLEDTINLNVLLKMYDEFYLKVILGIQKSSMRDYVNGNKIYFHISNLNYIYVNGEEYNVEVLRSCLKQ